MVIKNQHKISCDAFSRTQRELFPEDILSPHLEDVVVKTDEQRIVETMSKKLIDLSSFGVMT